MKDKLFDKIRASHKDSGGYQLPDDALATFRKYSSKRDRLSKSKFNHYLVASLVLLLLSSNIFWFLNNSKTSLSPSTTTSTNANALVTNIKTDTVYITKYLNSAQEASLANDTPIIKNKKEFLSTYYKTQLAELTSSIRDLENRLTYAESLNNITSKTAAYSNSKSSIRAKMPTRQFSKNTIIPISDTKTNQKHWSSELTILRQLPLNALAPSTKHRTLTFAIPINIEHKRRQTFIEMLTPKTVSLFGQLGFYYENASELPNISGSHYSLGITSLFSNHFRGRLSIGSAIARGEIENGKLTPSNFPQVVAPEGAVFDELYFSSRLYVASLGLEYLLKPIRFIRPYFGVNFHQGIQRYINIEYNFYHQNKKLEIAAANSIKNSNKQIGFLIGSDINLSSNLDGQISAGYNYQLIGNTGSYFLINAGLQYHF